MKETELPQWKCHKVMRASKIKDRVLSAEGSVLVLEHGNVKVSDNFIDKHNPQVGGYFVRYADGYESYSPAQAFEEGYTLIEEHRPHTGKERLQKARKGSR